METAGQTPLRYVELHPGDPAPWFTQRSQANPRYNFPSAAGRYIVLGFFATAGDARSRGALDALLARRAIFDDDAVAFFGVSHDPQDEAQKRVENSMPGVRYFWDFDGLIGRAYGSVPLELPRNAAPPVRRFWLVIDPMLRVMRKFAFAEDGSDVPALTAFLRALPPPALHAGVDIQAPVLILPRVFEPEFCARLIAEYERKGGTESGVMREVDGRTVGHYDHSFKRRSDILLDDETLIRESQLRIRNRVVPEIRKVHHFVATRMERYMVSCYAAEDHAHFKPHRDNTTKGTAHRAFAVSINLNENFEGGRVQFPEYGPRAIKAPMGCAVVFSTSLLHAVTEVTAGRRYAFLPFLYDEQGEKVRLANADGIEDAPPPADVRARE